mmetsp:Transcript_49785/g.132026  ORF Transcript_49785/g.132026 Transcript_49785/m.132026 type:complete len:106 (-) Transcript_49785:342-659(-)
MGQKCCQEQGYECGLLEANHSMLTEHVMRQFGNPSEPRQNEVYAIASLSRPFEIVFEPSPQRQRLDLELERLEYLESQNDLLTQLLKDSSDDGDAAKARSEFMAM